MLKTFDFEGTASAGARTIVLIEVADDRKHREIFSDDIGSLDAPEYLPCGSSRAVNCAGQWMVMGRATGR
jgi:hypothetical protein